MEVGWEDIHGLAKNENGYMLGADSCPKRKLEVARRRQEKTMRSGPEIQIEMVMETILRARLRVRLPAPDLVRSKSFNLSLDGGVQTPERSHGNEGNFKGRRSKSFNLSLDHGEQAPVR